jgi:hypothetical protein
VQLQLIGGPYCLSGCIALVLLHRQRRLAGLWQLPLVVVSS